MTASLPLLLTDGANDYIYGPNDKVIEQVDQNSGVITFLHQDRTGSTRVLTDGSGAVVGTGSYDPYGNTISTTGTATSPFGYDGEYTDISGLVYLRARYYDPATGQFLTSDPLTSVTRETYLYAGGDPINVVDPTGTYPIHNGADDNAYGYADQSGAGGNSADAPNEASSDSTDNPPRSVTSAEHDGTRAKPTFRPDASHIFRNDRGHLPDDTPENRALIQSIVEPENLISETPTKDGLIQLYRTILPDGRQVWAKVREGEITNGGVNEPERIVDDGKSVGGDAKGSGDGGLGDTGGAGEGDGGGGADGGGFGGGSVLDFIGPYNVHSLLCGNHVKLPHLKPGVCSPATA